MLGLGLMFMLDLIDNLALLGKKQKITQKENIIII